MGSSTTNARIDVTLMDPIGFNNKNHIENFMKYLFRTDKAQKWTNGETVNCFVLYKSKNQLISRVFPADLVERQKLYDRFQKGIFNVISKQSYKDVLNDIAYMDITDPATKQNIQESFTQVEIEDMVRQVLEAKPKIANRDLLHVVHVDQLDQFFHIHTMGV